ncbi:MAG TPA: aspartyl/asparaginyl beta-hydroxylase domain-containing protein [Solirubrobacteraceae bacterium]|nr:aspartyl/asparaginyl beta-hydroxylase domain-containing protein [Solirubrobacteraceae bacterium]
MSDTPGGRDAQTERTDHHAAETDGGARSGSAVLQGDPVAERILELLRRAGAEAAPHAGGRSLYAHLVETGAILARWGQPASLCRAGLLHSVYGTDARRARLLDLERHQDVVAIAGEEAARLARLFRVTPRGPLLAGTYRWARDFPWPEAATTAELDALVVIHMANLAEQARAGDGSPGRCLARLGRIASVVSDSAAVSLPASLAALALVDDDEEIDALRAYRAALERAEDPGARAMLLGLVVAGCPVVPEPCVWQAQLAWAAGEPDAARAWGRQARQRLAGLGFAWDKRLGFAEWERVAARFENPPPAPRASRPAAAHPRALLDVASAPDPRVETSQAERAGAGETGAGIGPRDLRVARRRFQRYVESLCESGGAVAYPELAARPWHDPAGFPLAAYLEANFAAIRAEILALPSFAFQPESERIARRGDWDVAFLYERGRRRHETCDACPVISHGLEAHGAVRTLDGLSYVSRMRAGTHIGAHRGPTNLRLRCHLGIVVPDGDCAIRVGEDVRHWVEGRCLVFDDHFEHEAWNRTDEDRIVLIVDLWHPDLTAAEQRWLTGLDASIARRARGLARYWSGNAAAGVAARRDQMSPPSPPNPSPPNPSPPSPNPSPPPSPSPHPPSPSPPSPSPSPQPPSPSPQPPNRSPTISSPRPSPAPSADPMSSVESSPPPKPLK